MNMFNLEVDVIDFHKNYILTFSGACVISKYNQKVKASIIGGFLDKITEADVIDTSPRIILSSELIEVLTPGELYFVIMHEQGHIASGHLKESVKQQGGVIDNIDFEIEADAYAISKGASSDDAKSALKKLISWAISKIENKKVDEEVIEKLLNNNADFSKRMTALSSFRKTICL